MRYGKVTYVRENGMARVYKHRDAKSNISICDFDDVWLHDNITTKPCFYCGSLQQIGADRIDNSKGHTKDNIVPCCKLCNLIRNQFFTHEDFKKVVDFCLSLDIGPFKKISQHPMMIKIEKKKAFTKKKEDDLELNKCITKIEHILKRKKKLAA